jgi:hypothetical protein
MPYISPVMEVKSHHHQVKVESPDETTRIIKLWQGPVPADRDFELTWTAAASRTPTVGLFRERVGQADYLLATVTPQQLDDAQEKPLPREVIFVIDNSGSMGGTSMVQGETSPSSWPACLPDGARRAKAGPGHPAWGRTGCPDSLAQRPALPSEVTGSSPVTTPSV